MACVIGITLIYLLLEVANCFFRKILQRNVKIFLMIMSLALFGSFYSLFISDHYKLSEFAKYYLCFFIPYISFRVFLFICGVKIVQPSPEFDQKYLKGALTALEKICKENLLPVTLGKKGNPQYVYEKMVAAGIPPEYPRPKPFVQIAPLLALFTALVFALGIVLTIAVLVPSSEL